MMPTILQNKPIFNQIKVKKMEMLSLSYPFPDINS